MKRVLSFGAVALLLLVPVAGASAQGKLSGFAAIGATTTTGELKDADSTKSGFFGQVGLEYKVSEPLWLRMDASMGWNDRITAYAEDAYIWTFVARLEYWLPFGSDKLRPYVNGGGGLMLYKRNPGETGREDTPEFTTKNRMMVSGGVGLDYRIGGTSIFVEGRYDMAFAKDGEEGSRTLIPIMLGARWGAW
ncbi:MAG TPA: outer membrane beta-barrel protein [Gemmatimonadaceae bacterium]